MAFNLPIGTTSVKKVGPTYTRPADWPTITDAAGEVQFLVADTSQAYYSIQVSFTGSPLIIDWGDGTTTNVAGSGSNYWNKQYTKGTGTSCSRGYTTFKIRIYSSGTSTITSARIGIDSTAGINNQSYSIGLLEAYYGDGTQQNGISSYFSSTASGPNSGLTYDFLEYVKMPSTVASAISYSYAFSYCANLRVVVLPTSSPGGTSWVSTFVGCSNLQSVRFPADTTISTLASAFTSCFSLDEIIFPSTLSSCTSINAAFQACYSLINLVMSPLSVCTDYGNAFNNCFNLTSLTFQGLHTGSASAISMQNMCNNCYKLEAVSLPPVVSSSSYNMTNAFFACYSLKTFTLPSGFVASSMNATFQTCYNLQYANITGNGAMTPLSSLQNTFNGCASLTEIYLPTTGTVGSVNMNGTINGCHSLESFSISNSFGPCITSTFVITNVYGLKTLTLPNTMNNITSISISGCYILESLTFPTSASSVTALIINSNYNLKNIVLPTTLGTLSTSFDFRNCYSLISISNIPTTTNLNTFGSAFLNCYSLRSIVLPATVNASNGSAYGTAFQNCFALESITFPTTQSTAATGTLNNMFSNCASLTTVINFDKINSNSTLLTDASGNTTNLLPGLTFSCRLSRLGVAGQAYQGQQNRITSLRVLNTFTGQWTGASPQVDVSYTNITYANLVQLFNDIAATGTYTGKTINITGCVGTSSLTASDRLILTSKGWTITG